MKTFSRRQFLGQASCQAVTALPVMNTLFGTAPIGMPVWLRVFAIALLVTVVVGIDKWLRRPRPDRA